jgi:hypothetical protein
MELAALFFGDETRSTTRAGNRGRKIRAKINRFPSRAIDFAPFLTHL